MENGNKNIIPNDSLSNFDKGFLGIFFVLLTICWVYVLFHPIPSIGSVGLYSPPTHPLDNFSYYFIIYVFPGGLVSLWMLGVWVMIICGLFSKQSANQTTTTLYRVDDEYDLYLKEAHKEIDDFLKYENDYNSKRTF